MCAVFSSKKFAKKLADEVKNREESNKKMLADLVVNYLRKTNSVDKY